MGARETDHPSNCPKKGCISEVQNEAISKDVISMLSEFLSREIKLIVFTGENLREDITRKTAS
jgi:hypothetical protein